MSELELGRVIGKDEQVYRDAVHIAICPVIAAHKLFPGQRIGIFTQQGEEIVVDSISTHIGIVDPYIPRLAVYKGDRFYMWLYPNTVTSLRHEWVHPAIKSVENKSLNPYYNECHVSSTDPEGVSKRWLEYFAKECELSYDQLMDATTEYLLTGKICCLGTDTPDICWNKNEQFWEHYQKISDKIVPSGKQESFFRCAC